MNIFGSLLLQVFILTLADQEQIFHLFSCGQNYYDMFHLFFFFSPRLDNFRNFCISTVLFDSYTTKVSSIDLLDAQAL